MKYHYVYRIDRPATGEWYVGIRSCCSWPTEDVYWGSGTRVKCIPVGELVKTILVIVQTREEAARIEKELVGPEQLEDPLCLNLRTGGDNDFTFTEATKRKISLAKKGNTCGRATKGVPKTAEHRANISRALRGHTTSWETRQKISRTMRGKQ